MSDPAPFKFSRRSFFFPPAGNSEASSSLTPGTGPQSHSTIYTRLQLPTTKSPKEKPESRRREKRECEAGTQSLGPRSPTAAPCSPLRLRQGQLAASRGLPANFCSRRGTRDAVRRGEAGEVSEVRRATSSGCAQDPGSPAPSPFIPLDACGRVFRNPGPPCPSVQLGGDGLWRGGDGTRSEGRYGSVGWWAHDLGHPGCPPHPRSAERRGFGGPWLNGRPTSSARVRNRALRVKRESSFTLRQTF